MTIALVIVCTLLGLAAVGSAAGKLTGNPKVMESLHSVGVTDAQVRALAGIEILGAAGLLVGIFVPALGIAAAAAFTLYFLGAVGAHVRAHQPLAHAVPPLAIALLAVVATLLQLQR